MKYPDNIQRKYLGNTQVYKKQWVGLTEEERKAIANATIRIHGQEWAYATAIEAKLKEKNT